MKAKSTNHEVGNFPVVPIGHSMSNLQANFNKILTIDYTYKMVEIFFFRLFSHSAFCAELRKTLKK